MADEGLDAFLTRGVGVDDLADPGCVRRIGRGAGVSRRGPPKERDTACPLVLYRAGGGAANNIDDVAKPKPDPRTDLFQSAFTTAGLVEAVVDAELEAAGVPPALFSLLGWISRLQPVAPTKLAAETGTPATTLRDNIHRLVERGDVRRVPNPGDGRSYLLELTPEGQRLIELGRPAMGRALRRLKKHLPRDTSEYLGHLEELRLALQLVLERSRARR